MGEHLIILPQLWQLHGIFLLEDTALEVADIVLINLGALCQQAT